MKRIKVAIVDDYELIRRSMSLFMEGHGYIVSFQAKSGEECLELIREKPVDIVLMDINMPGLGGIRATKWISSNIPSIKVIALSILDDENNVIRMLNAGARAYLVKNASPEDLFSAIEDVYHKGVHFSDIVTNHLKEKLYGESNESENKFNFSEREKAFLKLICTELTFKEIADKMYVSPRTVEGWRNNLCKKLGLKGRIGLALFAIRQGIST